MRQQISEIMGRQQDSEITTRKNALISSVSLVFVSVFILGIGIMWTLQMLGVGGLLGASIASQMSIAILTLSLYKFKYGEFIDTLRVDFKMKNIVHVILALLLVLGVNVAISLVISVFGLDTSGLDEFTSNTTEAMIGNGGIFVMIIIPVIIGPVLEELAFRAGFKKILIDKSKWKPYQYVIISSILFGLLHWQPGAFSIYPIIITMSMGVIHSILYLKTGNIFLPIASHMLYNLIILSTAFIMV